MFSARRGIAGRHRRRRLLLIAVTGTAVLAGGLLAGIEPAIASSPLSWASPVRADDQPPFAYPTEIESVSCISTHLCFAVDHVGEVLSSSSPAGGAGAWRRVYADSSAKLIDIACPSASLCVASGHEGRLLTTTEPAGSSWTPIKLGEAEIREVSCPSTSLCVAVDSKGDVITSTDPTGGVAAWTTTHIDTHESFSGISCPTSKLCVAGTYEGYLFTTTNPTGGAGAWSVSQLDPGHDLLAVSCSSESLCVLTDNYGNALVSTEPTGGDATWKVTHVARGLVESVSCASWGLCIALSSNNEVITSLEPTGGEGAWTSTTIELKNKYGGEYSIEGAACPAAGLCVLVDSGGAVLTSSEPTRGANSWTVTQLEVGSSGQWGISCASETLCVGADEGGNVVVSTDAMGGSGAWTKAHVDEHKLNGLACPSAGLCVVGDEAGNVVTSTDPTGGPGAWSAANVDGTIPIRRVSCPSVSMCVAIDREGDVLASTHPTGGSGAWSVFAVPHVGTLAGVSCPSEHLCVVVDTQGGVITSTNPAGGTEAWTRTYVDAPPSISCPSASLCVTAGGGSILTSTNPTGGASAWTANYIEGLNGLAEVSCAQGGFCVATSYGGNGSSGNVVVSSNPTAGVGAWIKSNVYGNPIEPPNPMLDLKYVELTGVSCVQEGMCAVADIDGRVMIGTPASTPKAPTVETKAASLVTQTTATMDATVNPNGTEVSECRFEYAAAEFYELTKSYESSTLCSSLPGSGEGAVSVSASISGLSANATYHFRISATNAGGTSKGSDETFRTQAALSAPAVVTGVASSITQNSATLSATVNPNGAEVSSCRLEYGLTPSYGSSAPCAPSPGSGSSAVSVSAAVSGLAEHATYHFRISATSAGGTSVGSDQTLRTLPAAHYYKNTYPSGLLPEGERLSVISWGTVTLTSEAPSTAPPTSCEQSGGGFVENPAGGGAGIGATESFASWDCANAACPAGTIEFPATSGKFVEKEFIVFAGGERYSGESLPWSSELFEAGEKLRSESKGVVIELACVAQKTAGSPASGGKENEPQFLANPTVCSTTPTNLQAPSIEKGANLGPNESKLIFDKESGKLLCRGPGAKAGEEISFEGATSGSLRLMGYKGSELILAK